MSIFQKKKLYGFFLFLIIGVIILSFVFTGFMGSQGDPNVVAKVNDTPIKIREYQRTLDGQMNMYSKIMGGKRLSAKHVEFLKKNVLNILINQKVMLNLANDLDILAGKNEVTQKIKDLPYFQTNKQFNLTLYKSLLERNGFTPQVFEETLQDELKTTKLQNILKEQIIATSFLNDYKKFKNQKKNVTAVTINKDHLKQHIRITKSEIKAYLNKKENLDKVKKDFEIKKQSFVTPEQIKLQTIALSTEGLKNYKKKLSLEEKVADLSKKINSKNFIKLQKKYSDKKSPMRHYNANNWYPKNQIPGPIANAIFALSPGSISSAIKFNNYYYIIKVNNKKEKTEPQFAKYKSRLAKENLQQQSDKKLGKLIKKVSRDVRGLLARRSFKELDKTVKKYGLAQFKDQEVNFLDLKIGPNQLTRNEGDLIFKKKSSQSVSKIERETEVIFVTSSTKKSKDKKKKGQSELTFNEEQITKISEKVQQDILKFMKDNSKIVQYPQLL